MKIQRAFTLIELLIVVAIIAILASIAVPNFLEAQVRSKVARAKNDMRTLALTLEAYHMEYNAYPEALGPTFINLRVVTTPIAYMTSLPEDPFPTKGIEGSPFARFARYYHYGSMPIETPASRWALASNGPDSNSDTPSIRFYPGYSAALFYEGVTPEPGGDVFKWTLYDPTNGTISPGDIFRASDCQSN